MNIPEQVFLYRIVHIENLDFILKSKKLTCPNSLEANSDYIRIGDKKLIGSRNLTEIPASGGKNFRDYIAFYFGTRSPMLYIIQNGFKEVIRQDAEDIIYLVTTFEYVKEKDLPYTFTDGHAVSSLSRFFDKEEDLKEVDWSMVKARDWADNMNDNDRKRRKQAEFLVRGELELQSLLCIGVYNEATKSKILTIFTENNYTCPVILRPTWYY